MEIKKFEEFEYPKGWVNIKVDDDVIKRMSRYVFSLDKLLKNRRDHYNLMKKVEILSKVDEYIVASDISIQDKISIIVILQYLNEIVNNFNASSAGFLFEHFLASLIHGKKDDDDYGKIDISTSYSEIKPSLFSVSDKNYKTATYQIKLYKVGGNIKISMEKLCDYYVICLKTSNGIDIHILSGRSVDRKKQYHVLNSKYLSIERNKNVTPILNDKVDTEIEDLENFISNFDESVTLNKTEEKAPEIVKLGDYRIGSKKVVKDNKKINKKYKYIVINTNKLKSNTEVVRLSTNNIDELIGKCGDNVKNSIGFLYNQLSELHYDVESLISGIDKNNKEITIANATNKSNLTLGLLKDAIENIKIL
jgi:hypothetical protein